MKYRKLPVVIDAVQWTGDNDEEVLAFSSACTVRHHTDCKEIEIRTLEDGHDDRAVHVASLNDFIIRGVHGEYYACKPDIFWKTYEVYR